MLKKRDLSKRSSAPYPVGVVPSLAASFLNAQDHIRSLKPAAFKNVPAKIREGLESRGCTIPQTPSGTGFENVIQGEFQEPGNPQWAVRCQRPDGGISVLVFGESGRNPAVAASFAAEQHACWTSIAPVGARFINEHYRAYGGVKPPLRIDHHGIDYQICEKASVVFYYYNGRWLQLTGAD